MARSNSLRQQSPQQYRRNDYVQNNIPPTVREYEAQPNRVYGQNQQHPEYNDYNGTYPRGQHGQPPRDPRDYRDPREYQRDPRDPREMEKQGQYPGQYRGVSKDEPDYRDYRDAQEYGRPPPQDNRGGTLPRGRENNLMPSQSPPVSPNSTMQRSPTGGHYPPYNSAFHVPPQNGQNGSMPPNNTSSLGRQHGRQAANSPQTQQQMPPAAQQYERVSHYHCATSSNVSLIPLC